jgi:hypothetical protein
MVMRSNRIFDLIVFSDSSAWVMGLLHALPAFAAVQTSICTLYITRLCWAWSSQWSLSLCFLTSSFSLLFFLFPVPSLPCHCLTHSLVLNRYFLSLCKPFVVSLLFLSYWTCFSVLRTPKFFLSIKYHREDFTSYIIITVFVFPPK